MSGGKLPEEWVKTTIGVICEVKGGKRLPKGKALLNTATEHPYIRVTDFENGSVNLSTIKYLDSDTYSAISNYTISKNDLYISIAGTIGLIGEIPEQLDNANLTENAAKLCFILGTDKKYLKHVLSSNKTIEQFDDKTTSSGQPKLALFRIRDCEFPYAPINEQKIIAEKLDTLLAQVDSTKARLEQIPQILKRFRQAVLTVAMSGGLTEEWRRSNSILFSSWVNSNIGELAQVATGKTPKRTEVKYWENGTIPWLTSSSTGEIYTDVAEQFITPIALKECTLKIFSPGTLLLAMYGEGKTRGQVTELKIHAACNQACAAIICNKEKIDLQFLKMRLMENYQETRKAAAGGNQPNLNLNKVREIPIIVPPLPEQHEIVRRVEQLFAYADTIEKQVNSALTRVNSLTQSILAKAFRGELTAQWRAENPELISGENSAAALLEKIKAERAASGGKKNSRKKA